MNSKLSIYYYCKKIPFFYKNLWGFKNKNCFFRSLSKKRSKLTRFANILGIKQTLKFFYNINEKIFKKFLLISLKSSVIFIDKFISMLEKRLDIALFRSGLVKSIFNARQLINHKLVYVNNKIIINPNKKLNINDLIAIKSKPIELNYFLKNIKAHNFTNYLEIDFKNNSFIFLWDNNLKNTYFPIKINYLLFSRFYK